MKVFELRTEIRLPRSRQEVFGFFADAGNLEAITPDWLHFRILTPLPIAMRQGALIRYRLRLHGIPMRWKTEITAWDPPHRFVDEQLRGPYRLWVHEHTFQEVDGGTLVGDYVRYAVLGGPLVEKLFVGREVRRIFAFRAERLRERFGAPGRVSGATPPGAGASTG